MSFGAENGIRTRDLNLGKVALYQLSYFRVGTAKVERKTLNPNKTGYFFMASLFSYRADEASIFSPPCSASTGAFAKHG